MPWGIVGHQWAVDLLKRDIAHDRVRHSYLFSGPPDTGKRTLALTLARALNCAAAGHASPGGTPLGLPDEAAAAGEAPCGTCRSCRLAASGSNLDITVVQGASGSLRVDQIRELQKQLVLTPNEGRYRVAVLLRFHEANASAANALLKTLEEPPPRVKLLLTADSTGALLPTIVSRCEVLELRPLPVALIRAALVERWNIPPERAALLAHLCGGRLGWAVAQAQDEAALERRASILSDLRSLLGASRVARFAHAEKLAKSKDTLAPETLSHWLSYWRDVLLVASGAQSPLSNVDHESEIRALAASIPAQEAARVVRALRDTGSRLDRNVNARLALEVLLLDLPRL